MPEFDFEDVNEALPILWHALLDKPVTSPGSNHHILMKRQSRNGPTVEFARPVIINYKHPRQRVLLSKVRDANPFFHMFEAIWMLAGRDDVAFLARFASRMKGFSDDGVKLHGAYGMRWNTLLPSIIDSLRKDKNTRRCHMPLFFREDVHYEGKDMPCNTAVVFYARNGFLDMTVFNRSNDLIWGALGANYVHFGFLQEYVAAMTDLEVGTYSQVSTCLHIYTEFDITKKMMPGMKVEYAPTQSYASMNVRRSAYWILSGADDTLWQHDAAYFLDHFALGDVVNRNTWHEPFFKHVAAPMYRTWFLFKQDKIEDAFAESHDIRASDWKFAARQWMDLVLERRRAKQEQVPSKEAGEHSMRINQNLPDD